MALHFPNAIFPNTKHVCQSIFVIIVSFHSFCDVGHFTCCLCFVIYIVMLLVILLRHHFVVGYISFLPILFWATTSSGLLAAYNEGGFCQNFIIAPLIFSITAIFQYICNIFALSDNFVTYGSIIFKFGKNTFCLQI